MKTLKHFCLTMLHVFSFLCLMHMVKIMSLPAMEYSELEIWFVSLISMINLYLMLHYMGLMLGVFKDETD